MQRAQVASFKPASPDDPRRFQTEGRGIVRAASGGFYVARRADEELYGHLSKRQPCHVLAPRQMGKSSLRVRTMDRLAAAGVRTVNVDLTGIGTDTGPEEWYFSLASTIVEGLAPDAPLEAFWRSRKRMSPVRRFREVLVELLLTTVQAPIVVFVDEIDVTLKLPFSRDDFFGVIRELHQARAADARLDRLTFCLIGVATPLDLVQDAERTPFNTSVGVHLSDFTLEEVQTLLPGLGRAGGSAKRLLEAIYAWTEGHPALTQRLCYWLTDRYRPDAAKKPPAERVLSLVRALFLRGGRIDDPILYDVEKRFADDRMDAHVPLMLHVYRRLLAGERIPADGNNPRQLGLRIAGLVTERRDEAGTWLGVRNRIVREVFGPTWVEHKLGRRLLTEPLEVWRESGRRDEHVLRGQALDLALKWAEGKEDVTPDERDYLAASQAVALREHGSRKQAEVDRALRDKALIEKRAAVTVAAILTALVVVLGVLYQNASLKQKALTTLAEREREERKLAEQKWHDAARLAEDLLAQSKAEADRQSGLLTRASEDAARARDEANRVKGSLEDAQKLVSIGQSYREKANRLQTEYERKDREAQALEERAKRAEEDARRAKAQEEAARAALEARTKETDAVTTSLTASLEAFQEEAQRTQEALSQKVTERDTKNGELTAERDTALVKLAAREADIRALKEENARLRNEVALRRAQK